MKPMNDQTIENPAAFPVRCEICNEGPTTTGVSLIRVNAKGVPGIWRCHAHAKKEQMASRDSVVADIVQIIEDDNRKTAGL